MVYLSAILLSGLLVLLYRMATLKERAARLAIVEEQVNTLSQEKAGLQAKVAELSARLEEKKLSSNIQEQLSATFKALSTDVLKDSQKSFFDVAKATFEKYEVNMQQKQVAVQELVKPLQESLQKVDGKIHELEKLRLTAYVSMNEHLKGLITSQLQLQAETSKLAKALHAPTIRGKWGEVQLRRVLELSGMVAYCDFVEQVHLEGKEGRLRPDLVVRLPNSRSLVVDAKTPLQAYLEAQETTDNEVREAKLREHAKQLKHHLTELGAKAYWEHFQPAPEFVVLFLPAESFFSAALEYDPTLIEYGVERHVLMATPTSLIALLRAVAFGWKEEMVAEHAQAISDLGKTLYERLQVMTEHFVRLKKSLSGSVEAYNKIAASFETRVLPAARRFQEMGATNSAQIPLLEPIEAATRAFTEE